MPTDEPPGKITVEPKDPLYLHMPVDEPSSKANGELKDLQMRFGVINDETGYFHFVRNQTPGPTDTEVGLFRLAIGWGMDTRGVTKIPKGDSSRRN